MKSNQVVQYLNKIHQDYPGAIWITGGAVGLDSLAAEFAMSHGIELWLILPFPPKIMNLKWSQSQKDVLKASVAYSKKFSVLSPIYDVSIYQLRNERMVDLSDMVAAFWDGSRGGTGNCVRYARSVGRKMVYLSDFSGVMPQEGFSFTSTFKMSKEICVIRYDNECDETEESKERARATAIGWMEMQAAKDRKK